MMHKLVMPDPFAGTGIQCQDRVSVKVTADPVAAVVIVCGRTQRIISDPAFGIHGYFAPGIHAPNVFVGIFRPGVVPIFAWVRNGMECPGQLARDHIISPHIAGRRHIIFAGRGSQQQQIFEYFTWCARLGAGDGQRIAAQALSEIDQAIVTEIQNGFSRECIDRLKVIVHLKYQPPVFPVFAFPVIDATGCDTL